jgi:hypothetical protein
MDVNPESWSEAEKCEALPALEIARKTPVDKNAREVEVGAVIAG